MKAPAIVGITLVIAAGVAGNAWQFHRSALLGQEIERQKATAADLSRALADERTKHDEEVHVLKTHQQEERAAFLKYIEVSKASAAAERALAESQKHVITQMVRQREVSQVQALAEDPSIGGGASETYAPRSSTQNDALPIAKIKAEVARKAERYFKTQHVNGSGSSLVSDFTSDVDEPRARQGWPNRYEVTGEAFYQFYDSIWGGSFSNYHGTFTAEVEVSGGAIRVLDFTRRS